MVLSEKLTQIGEIECLETVAVQLANKHFPSNLLN
jgi:hypothetical protein